MVLDYGEPDDHISTQREEPVALATVSATYPEGDWTHVEKNWANLSKITEATQLQAGSLVGWKVCSAECTS